MADCGFFSKRGILTMTAQEWIDKHAPHHKGEFRTEPHNHPSQPMIWLICDCGARLLTMTTDANPEKEG